MRTKIIIDTDILIDISRGIKVVINTMKEYDDSNN